MFRQITIVTCDYCGKNDEPRIMYSANGEAIITTPIGWSVAPHNHGVHLCATCTRKLEGGNRHV